MSTLTNIPVADTPGILAAEIDGKAIAAFRPIVDMLGMAYSAQLQKLKAKSWAVVSKFNTTGADGKTYEMVGVDRKTLTMYLATLDENRVKDEVRPILIALQAEAADALDAYFNKGAAINPRADEHQINAQIFQSRARMELLQAAKGLIHPDHLEAKARVLIAYGLGEGAQLDPARTPLYCKDFLASKNASRARISSIASQFGKKVKKAYIEATGNEPKKYPLTLPNGQTREVLAYTEADRPLLEQVWSEHYAPLTLV
ncbi:phage antirepressor N-terminal domain-containing protein [Rhodococcus sp. BH5]|uniref:phage antirepressor N-terminal domain-containing protein n=1 Tax=Rhodococcus sp. BH5 TaxID=2871702 RepID=UPI0022CD2E51|nr:phage antirepressor N-terminal domain-containing protein [Rhodococcus sp. BH5]MCZ9631354.1 phage antirepressor N-terminal domain-containing protein [Rhodococcus sp. BH5]